MIRLGLRLTVAGGREAVVRLLATAFAVTLGVGMLLTTLAGINAVHAQNARYGWLESGSTPVGPAGATHDAVHPLLWRLAPDEFRSQTVGRLDVAATGADSPVPPGIPHLPGPGQYYASPALARLLHTTPYAELGARYGGVQVGTIGAAALPSPDTLLVVIGHSASQLAASGDVRPVYSISTTAPDHCTDCVVGVGINANGLVLILSVITLALFFPILIFVATAARLSAARREQRFAAMRLVGATPRQVAMIAAVESSLAAVAGVLLGFGLFAVLRPSVARIRFTGSRFFVSDLSLSLTDVLLVAIGVPVVAAVAALVSLRRVQISPLGVSRRVTPRPPGAWRLIPLVAGVGELAYFVAVGRPSTTGGQVLAYLPGFASTMLGLVLAGPWLTMVGSRLLARRTGRPAVLIAGRRLADNPKGGFRAISGVILAVFVASVSTGVITTLISQDGSSGSSAADRGTLLGGIFGPQPSTAPALDTAGLLGRLGKVPGVRGVAVLHDQPDLQLGPQDGGLVSCADLATTPVLGRCPSGATVVTARPDFGGGFVRSTDPSQVVWPASAVSLTTLARYPAHELVVQTDGSTAAVERVRTVLESYLPQRFPPLTISEMRANSRGKLAGYQQLSDVVILASLVIAGCSLAVSVVAGLIDRRRPFSLLRLAGTPLGVLRRVVTYETALPLLVTALVSAGVGLLAAQLFLRAQLGYSLTAPTIGYYGILAAGLVASLAILAATLPVLRRITGPETARNE